MLMCYNDFTWITEVEQGRAYDDYEQTAIGSFAIYQKVPIKHMVLLFPYETLHLMLSW